MARKPPSKARRKGRVPADAAGAAAPTLVKFMQAKARAGCAVCQLPAAVRAQLGTEATKRGFTRADQVEWLRGACGVQTITVDGLDRHFRGRHDEEVS